ncbi:hypothetical protein G9A89_000071 [Geosiphon pyriformis]|nr:hypothetical protein G9A89_000071 [Geosiphon pyriformis]
MKKTIKVSGSESGFKVVVSRKKKKRGVLAESDTTESESIDMEEECLVEETSVDYDKSGAFAEGDPNQCQKAMMAAGKLANDHGIVINTNLKHLVNNRTNWAIVLKKISLGTSVEAVHAAVSKFGKIKVIKMQLVGLWQKMIIELEDQTQIELLASKWSIFIRKDVVCVARADIDKQLWDARNNFRALLHTLLMRTTAHDL